MTYSHSIHIKNNICVFVALCLSAVAGVYPAYGQKVSQAQSADTVTLANKLITEKKIWQANKLLRSYCSRHSKDFSAFWLSAQTSTWLSNYGQADSMYRRALKLQPGNDQLLIDYTRELLYKAQFRKASKLLDSLEKMNTSQPAVLLLRARQYYWIGEPAVALNYIDKVLAIETGNTEALQLREEIRLATALKLGVYGSYLVDNQPYETYLGNLKVEKYFNKYLDLYFLGNEYSFRQPLVAVAQWATVNNKMYFPSARLHLNYGGGFIKFPSGNNTDWTASAGLLEDISPHFSFELNGEHAPYMDTRKSVDSNLSVYRVAAKLNFHKRQWSAQAAYVNTTFQDNNNVNAKYAWLLAPIWITPISKLHIGYSFSYSNSDKNRYVPTKSFSQLLNEYSPGYKIAGAYDPYFTPIEMVTNSLLFSFNIDVLPSVNFGINGDIGTGTTSNPYLYFAKDSAGPVHVATGYTSEHFTPYNVTTALNFSPGNTWLIAVRYTYRNTFFFNSNYVSIGIEKSFAGSNKIKKRGVSDDFSMQVMDIEQRLKGLADCKDGDKLLAALSKIKGDLRALREKQNKKLAMSELAPDSDEASQLQDHIDGLDEMIRDIETVELDRESLDSDAVLKEKARQLSSISYRGSNGR